MVQVKDWARGLASDKCANLHRMWQLPGGVLWFAPFCGSKHCCPAHDTTFAVQ